MLLHVVSNVIKSILSFISYIINMQFDTHAIYTYSTHHICVRCTGWRRPTGRLIFPGHFLQKSPMISGSFVKNDLQLKASYQSVPPCMCAILYVYIAVNRRTICYTWYTYLFIFFTSYLCIMCMMCMMCMRTSP